MLLLVLEVLTASRATHEETLPQRTPALNDRDLSHEYETVEKPFSNRNGARWSEFKIRLLLLGEMILPLLQCIRFSERHHRVDYRDL